MADEWTVPALRSRCWAIRQQLLVREVASLQEIEEYWPGGAENKDKSRGGWIFCYANLVRMLGRQQEIDRSDPVLRARADKLLTEALREAPINVELVSLGEDGRPRYMKVHPKCFNTLVEIDERDRWIQRLAAVRQVLFDRAAGDDLELVRQISDEVIYQHKIILTILNHPGCGSPFEDGNETEPASWTKGIDAVDVLRGMQAHHRVHRERLQAVTTLFNPDDQPGPKGRGAWSTLLSLYADKTGVPAPGVARNVSLEAVCAQLYITAEANREAYEAAKDRS